MRRFHRPDPLFKPIDEGQIIGGAAKQSLAKMQMSLDESGQYRATAGLDDGGVSVFDRTDTLNATVSDQQIAAHDGILFVHRDNAATLNQYGAVHYNSSTT